MTLVKRTLSDALEEHYEHLVQVVVCYTVFEKNGQHLALPSYHRGILLDSGQGWIKLGVLNEEELREQVDNISPMRFHLCKSTYDERGVLPDFFDIVYLDEFLDITPITTGWWRTPVTKMDVLGWFNHLDIEEALRNYNGK